MKINEILEGHINELKALAGVANPKKEEIFAKRAAICNNCPLKNGNNCNPRLFMDPETMDISTTRKPGYVKGCGCRLSAKQRSPSSECPAGFWGNEFKN